MSNLQELFDRELHKVTAPNVLVLEAVENCLRKVGIRITNTQRKKLKEDIANCEEGKILHIEISDKQIDQLKPLSEIQIKKKVERALGRVFQEAERLLNRKMNRVPRAVKSSIAGVVKAILEFIKRDSDELLLGRQDEEDAFAQNLFRVWGSAFYSIRTLGYVGVEIGSRNAMEPKNDPEHPDYKREALRRIHARACQVIQEIRVLLESGYADGAYARWRCLHEMSVVSGFIAKHNQELAERYLLHEIVENMKSARHEIAVNKEMLTDAETAQEFETLVEAYDTVVSRFGKAFSKGYGWASGEITDPHITFEKLERLMEHEPLRADYHLSSTNVHAGPMGDSTRLGLRHSQGSALLAGPSNVGLEIPGVLAARSYCMISMALLCLEPTIDQLVEVEIIRKLSRDVELKFIGAAKRLAKMGKSGADNVN